MNCYDKTLHTWEFIDMACIVARINGAVERFSKGGWVKGVVYHSRWEELEPYLRTSRERYHSSSPGGVKVNAGTLAGRMIITFERGEKQITIIGHEGNVAGGCGLHSIEASVKEAEEMIDTVISNWKIEDFKPNRKASIV